MLKKIKAILLISLMGSFAFADNNELFFEIALYSAENANLQMNVPIEESNLQIYIEPEEIYNCIILEEFADGKVQVLYNDAIDSGFFFPSEANFFELGETEKKEKASKIHLVVSKEQNKKLQNLIKKNDSVGLLNEINNLKKESSKVAETPVKPVTIGAGSRGLFSPSKRKTTQIIAENIYVKTFRIKK